MALLGLNERTAAVKFGPGVYWLTVSLNDIVFLGTQKTKMQTIVGRENERYTLYGPFFYEALAGTPKLYQVDSQLLLADGLNGVQASGASGMTGPKTPPVLPT